LSKTRWLLPHQQYIRILEDPIVNWNRRQQKHSSKIRKILCPYCILKSRLRCRTLIPSRTHAESLSNLKFRRRNTARKDGVKHRFYPTWAVRLQRDEHMMDKYTPTCRRWKRNPRAGSQLLLSLPSKLSRHTARLRAILVHGILRLLLLGIVQHKAGDQLFEERSGSSFNSTA